MRIIGSDIWFECFFCWLIQEIIFRYQLLQLKESQIYFLFIHIFWISKYFREIVHSFSVPVIECLQFCSMKIQTHSMAPLLASNIARNRALEVEESKVHDQNFLHHEQFDQHDEYTPVNLINIISLNEWKIIDGKMSKNRMETSYTLGSSGGSNWTIQSTAGMSKPRAATSVHKSVPDSALQNWKNVVVRLVCFCFPWIIRVNVIWCMKSGLVINCIFETVQTNHTKCDTLTWIDVTGKSM